MAGDFLDVGVGVEVEVGCEEVREDTVVDEGVEFVETCFEDFIADFAQGELLVEGLQELGLLLESWGEAG